VTCDEIKDSVRLAATIAAHVVDIALVTKLEITPGIYFESF
jgi:hypothetical protein